MRLGISFRQATRFCLTLCFATAFGGCTYVRVCDDQGNAIADARITYQKFSIGGAFDAGLTDTDGELTIGPTMPAIENIWAGKDGYLGGISYPSNRGVVYIVLRKQGANNALSPLTPILPPPQKHPY